MLAQDQDSTAPVAARCVTLHHAGHTTPLCEALDKLSPLPQAAMRFLLPAMLL